MLLQVNAAAFFALDERCKVEMPEDVLAEYLRVKVGTLHDD